MTVGTRASWAGATHLPQGLIFPELVHSGMVETLVQNTDAFNGASLNAIRLLTARRMGDYAQESFFKNISGLVSRRLVANSPDNPAVTPSQLPIDEHISIKLNRRIGPVDQTLDSFRKLGENADLEVLSFTLGEQVAKAIQVDQLDAGLRAVAAAILGQSALKVDADAASPSLITTDDLVSALANFGDAANRIVIWVMHSKPFYDLVKQQIGLNIDGISNFNIANASPVTLNRPVLVTDSAALTGVDASSPQNTTYFTLGLTAEAVVLEDSEEELIYTDIITGRENVVARMQGEFAYNVKCRGFKWDVSNGGVNPSNTALATSTNWDKAMTDDKDLAGVVIESL